jgi:hypothetical protein
METRPVTLAGLADGAAGELWGAALERVLENIEDANTDHKARRAITLSFAFSADEERRVGDITITCATKLAGVKGVKTVVSFGRHEGRRLVVEHPRQQDLFASPAGKPRLAEVAEPA